MKFRVLINRWANFYFFIANLSEWHFSCRKRYNFFWLAADDKFSKTEKKYLKIFKKILLKYHFFRYLGILFSTTKIIFNREFVLFHKKFFEITDVVLFKKKQNRFFIFPFIGASVRKRAAGAGQKNGVA